ncbi:MAG TPA: hypothetical protein VKN18_30490 [Blastocatellia bacterium]|nr:hypothetical protein [Blastocatellia bacterium]
MKSKRDARTKSDGLKSKKGTKRHASRKNSPPLIPVPEKLSGLLELVNLLPVRFDHPYKHSIVYESPKNDPGELYRMLAWVLDKLPIELQAFVLRDGIGEIDDEYGPIQSQPYIEIERNFAVLQMKEPELKTIVQDTWTRIRRALECESQSASNLDLFYTEEVNIAGRRYAVWASSELASRARDRLLFLLAAEETLRALDKSDAWMRLLRMNDSPLRIGAQARLYIAQIGDQKGKIAIHPPVLYERLEGVDAARIRECLICSHIFWAGRIDKFCCSDKCLAAQRSRKYRDKYKTQYARQRSDHRQKKTQITKLRKGSKASR